MVGGGGGDIVIIATSSRSRSLRDLRYTLDLDLSLTILFIFVSYSENEYYLYLFQNYNLFQPTLLLFTTKSHGQATTVHLLFTIPIFTNLKFYIFAQSKLNPKLRSLHLFLSFLEYTVV